MMLTAARLREVLDYAPETGVFRWRLRSGCRAQGSIAGCVGDGRYIRIRVDGVLYLAHRLAWLHVYGCWPEDKLDHRRGGGLENRLSNLRECSNAGNAKNSRMHKNNRLRSKGVIERNGRYVAKIFSDGQSHWLGTFDSVAEAAAAYDLAAHKYHGEFARPNGG